MRVPVILHTALHAEARPFIDRLGARKQPAPGAIGLFSNPATNIHILISGVGKIRSAAALGFACERLSPSNTHCHIMNVGIAGSADEQTIGNLCAVEKVIDRSTSHSYYPDMLLVAPGIPVTCETHETPVLNSEMLVSPENIVDMEASAVFEAGRIFCSSSTVQVFKVISDGLACSIPSMQTISDFVSAHVDDIGDFIEQTQNSSLFGVQILDAADEFRLSELATMLKLTATQNASLLNHARFHKVRHGMLPEQLFSAEFTPTSNKQARNKLFAQIQTRLNA